MHHRTGCGPFFETVSVIRSTCRKSTRSPPLMGLRNAPSRSTIHLLWSTRPRSRRTRNEHWFNAPKLKRNARPFDPSRKTIAKTASSAPSSSMSDVTQAASASDPFGNWKAMPSPAASATCHFAPATGGSPSSTRSLPNIVGSPRAAPCARRALPAPTAVTVTNRLRFIDRRSSGRVTDTALRFKAGGAIPIAAWMERGADPARARTKRVRAGGAHVHGHLARARAIRRAACRLTIVGERARGAGDVPCLFRELRAMDARQTHDDNAGRRLQCPRRPTWKTLQVVSRGYRVS